MNAILFAFTFVERFASGDWATTPQIKTSSCLIVSNLRLASISTINRYISFLVIFFDNII